MEFCSWIEGRVLTGTGGVEMESIIVRLRTASSFMARLVMRTRFQLGLPRLVSRDLKLGRSHTAEVEYMIVLLLEVGCYGSAFRRSLTYNCFHRCCVYLR